MVLIFIFIPFFRKSEPKTNEYLIISDQIEQLKNSIQTPEVINSTPMYGTGSLSESVIQNTPTIENTPIVSTPTPIIEYVTVEVPKYMPFIEGQELVVFRYSYYYPPLGGVNCRLFENGECISTMASGDRWQDYMYRAVACSSEYPLGTQILVVAPEEIKGTYICLDRGGGIEGTDLLDFLDDTQRLPWLEKVYAYIMK